MTNTFRSRISHLHHWHKAAARVHVKTFAVKGRFKNEPALHFTEVIVEIVYHVGIGFAIASLKESLKASITTPAITGTSTANAATTMAEMISIQARDTPLALPTKLFACATNAPRISEATNSRR